MCTAVTWKTKDHYFGRNLDLEYSYEETVTITPRNYGFSFRKMPERAKHYAMIGMAYVVEDYPLYYDAVNEKGLAMAGLSFPDYAFYQPEVPGKDNITPFEFIPWILGQCADLKDAKMLLQNINLLKEDFSQKLPLSPLHWIIADRYGAVTVEAVREGLRVYQNTVGVLTNNPPFDYHMANLSNYLHLSAGPQVRRFAGEGNLWVQEGKGDHGRLPVEPYSHGREAVKLPAEPYSHGMGAIGLPGDLSSASRFVKAAFTRLNSRSGDRETESVSQFFHILGSVEQQRGCSVLEDGSCEITVYSSCCNTDRGIYYYTTYDNRQITGVDMHGHGVDGSKLICYPLRKEQSIQME